MNLSPQQIRLYIGLGNLVLLLLIAWLVYGTFWTVEPAEYEADWIELKKIAIGMPGAGSTREDPRRYNPIVDLFGKPIALSTSKPTGPINTPKPVKKTGPVEHLIVKGFIIDRGDNPAMHACILSNNRARPPSEGFFYIGDELSAKKGFEKIRGWVVKDIVPLNEVEGQVILVSPSGKENVIQLERKEG